MHVSRWVVNSIFDTVIKFKCSCCSFLILCVSSGFAFAWVNFLELCCKKFYLRFLHARVHSLAHKYIFTYTHAKCVSLHHSGILRETSKNFETRANHRGHLSRLLISRLAPHIYPRHSAKRDENRSFLLKATCLSFFSSLSLFLNTCSRLPGLFRSFFNGAVYAHNHIS